MKKSFARKLCVAFAVVTAIASVTGCNRKLKVTYEYNAADYVKLGEYKGVKINVDESAIEKKVIDARVQSDLDSVTPYSEVKREAKEEDQVTISFSGAIGGQVLEGFSSESYSLILGKDEFAIDGFISELYGMKAGDTKVITLVVPEGLQDADEYVGKRIVFNISMLLVEAAITPQVTDVYVKQNFSYNTVDEYRQAIKSELAEDIADQIYDAKYQAALIQVQDNAEMLGYPQDLIDSKTVELNDSISFYSLMYGMDADTYCKDRYGISFDEYVRKSIAQQFILQQIIVQEGITIDEYYYKGNLAEFAKARGYSNPETMVEKYGKDLIVKQMLVQKAVDMIMESVVNTAN